MFSFVTSPVVPEVSAKNILGKGKGLIATEPISGGKRIIQEAPLCTGEDPVPIEICLMYRRLNSAEQQRYRNMLSCPDRPDVLATYREQLINQYDGITGNMILQPHHVDGIALIVAKFCNNYFTLRKSSPEVPGIQGIFLRAARLNHSCIPNCHASWNRAIQRLCVHTIRDIAKDEELLIMYTPDKTLFQDCTGRMLNLQRLFLFECDCAACDTSTMEGAILEAKRVQMIDLANGIIEHTDQNEDLPLSSKVIEVIKLMGEIGLDIWEKGQFNFTLAKTYRKRGEYARAEEELLKVEQLALTCLGNDNEITKEVQEVLSSLKQEAAQYQLTVDNMLNWAGSS